MDGTHHAERAAGQDSYVTYEQVYLVGRGSVELEVPEGWPPGRSNPRGLATGCEGLLESAHPLVDRPSSSERPLGPLGIALLERGGCVFEHGDRLVEDRVSSPLNHALGVDR